MSTTRQAAVEPGFPTTAKVIPALPFRNALPVMVSLVLVGLTFVAAMIYAGNGPLAGFVVASSVIGVYMAMNIGANDVANNVAAAVGSRAITLTGAIIIAAICEAAGALIAGGDVVSTISKGIIAASAMPDAITFVLAMGSALLAAALWLNLATWLGAPVSTTHAIVGGVLGAGIAAGGFGVVNWIVMSQIAASWFVSPILGGLIAAGLLAALNRTIFSRDDMVAASRRAVPVVIAVMVSAFAVYLTMKGLKKVWKAEAWMIVAIAAATFLAAAAILRPVIARAAARLENRRASINTLFNIPLVFAAALLSFAHGANDVANAVGPLSAIVSTVTSGSVAAKVGIPLWVMLIGAAGIVAGLALFGAKLIRTVGTELTSLDQTRAFCISLSAAITVIAASAMALPVSSTHIAVGAVFGVGFYREYLCNRSRRNRTACETGPRGLLAGGDRTQPVRLVRRRSLLTIVAAWFITVPSAAALSGVMLLVSLQVWGG